MKHAVKIGPPLHAGARADGVGAGELGKEGIIRRCSGRRGDDRLTVTPMPPVIRSATLAVIDMTDGAALRALIRATDRLILPDIRGLMVP